MIKFTTKSGRYMQGLISRVAPMMIISFVLIGILFPDTAFAANDELQKALLKLQQTISVGFALVNAAFWPILLMIGSLMDNNLIFGPGIGERLREIWVVMRNLVNIAFVFLLLVVAFYNVTGLGGEGNFALKTVLPKFVIALVAVNFSFLACKVILDAANVVSMAVYDLTGSIEDYDATAIKGDMEYLICTNPTEITATTTTTATGSGTVQAAADAGADSSALSLSQGWSYKNASPVAKAFCCSSNTKGEEKCSNVKNEELTVPKVDDQKKREIFPAFNDTGTKFFKQIDQSNIGIIMAINLGGLTHLTEVADNGGEVDIKGLSINTLFSILMYVVFGFAYIALFIVLLARLVVLWFVIAMSPLIALTMVVPQINQYASELNLVEKFVQHLLAPIIIGLSMSIGYLLTDKIKATDAGGIDIGGAGNSSFSALMDDGGAGTFLAPNVSDLQQLMVVFIAIAVVWMGVFGAADKTIASSVTNPIKEFGTKAAKFLAKLPTYAPIVPIMTKEGEDVKPYSFSEITSVMKDITNIPEQWSQTRARQLSKDLHIIPSTSNEFDKYMKQYDSAVGNQNKADAMQTLLANVHETGDYKQLKEALVSAGVKSKLPDTVDGFDNWYRDRGGYQELNTAYQTSNFKSSDYVDHTGAHQDNDNSSSNSGNSKAAKAAQQFNTFYGGNSIGDTKDTKVAAAVAKMTAADSSVKIADTNHSSELGDLLSRITDASGDIDATKSSRLRFDAQGRLMIAKSLEDIPSPAGAAGS